MKKETVTKGNAPLQRDIKTPKKPKKKSVPAKEPIVSEKENEEKTVGKLTIMQKRAVKKLSERSEKVGKTSLGEVLLESGYSKSISRVPSRVFKSPSVVHALKKLKLHPDTIKEMHEEVLNTKERYTLFYPSQIPYKSIVETIEACIPGSIFTRSITDKETHMTEYEFMVPNIQMKARMIELAYKIFPPQQTPQTSNIEKHHEKQTEVLKNLIELKKSYFLKNKIKWTTDSQQKNA